MRDPFWTDDRVDILRDLWESGRAARAIANILKTTRNAVIGKAHRMEFIYGERAHEVKLKMYG
jgi:hypothetical protein